ncbi:MAG: hypothetical protein R3190_03715, partial [Thermoanaerobaculia bacterium]|nr:hypothetical protein [Thermoanaerobaculia bacterium]
MAEIKLEEAVANLDRLDDIVAEVERSLRSLKRQANAARRYREREAAFEHVLETLLFARWETVQASLGEQRGQLERLRGEEAELSARLSRSEAALATGREEVETLAESVSRRHARMAELLALVEGRQEYLKGARQAKTDAGERLSRGHDTAQRLEAELEAHRQALAGRSGRHAELESDLDEAKQAVALDDAELDAAREALRAAEARQDTLRAEILASSAALSSLQSRLHEERIEAEKCSYRRDHNRDEIAKLDDQLEAANAIVAETGDRAGELEAAIATRGDELEAATRTLQTTLAEEGEAVQERDALGRRIARMEQRERFLAELEAAEAERR